MLERIFRGELEKNRHFFSLCLSYKAIKTSGSLGENVKAESHVTAAVSQ